MPTQNFTALPPAAAGTTIAPAFAHAARAASQQTVNLPRATDSAIREIPNPMGALERSAAGQPSSISDSRQLLEATARRIQAMLDSPDFQAMLAILDIAREMKQSATDMINNGSGEVDERLMSIVNQTLKEVENLQTFAKSMQDSVNRSREALARYT